MPNDEYKQAKADEKAARKRARAARPWFKKKRFVLGLPIVALIAIGIVGAAISPPEDEAESQVRVTETITSGATTTENVAVIETTTATETPKATATPARTPSPSPTPEPPVVLEGSGDDIVDLAVKPARLAHITGNAASRFFAVVPYSGSKRGSSLVNTTDAYDGIVPLDFLKDEKTDSFEVSATGAWRIEILPLSAARSTSDKITGTGDEVVRITGTHSTARIIGNAASRYFGVRPYGGSSTISMVNTTDAYDGRVRIPSGTTYLEVKAEGEWQISLE